MKEIVDRIVALVEQGIDWGLHNGLGMVSPAITVV